MTDIIERVKQNPSFKQDVSRELTEFRKEAVAGRAQAGEILLVQNRALQQATQVMAEDIYDLTEENDNLTIENNGLRNQLGTCLNENQLKKYCKDKKLELGTDNDRNKRILDRLNKRLAESDKQIKYSSNAASLIVAGPSAVAVSAASATASENPQTATLTGAPATAKKK